MKKILAAAVLITMIFVLFTSGIYAYASEKTISETDIKNLISQANVLYRKYQDGISETDQYCVLENRTVEKEKVSNEAKAVYTDNIADDMWMFRCTWDRKNNLPENETKTFTDNGDGTVTFISFIPQGIRIFYVLADYSFGSFLASGLAEPDDIIVDNITGDDNTASADIMMFYHQGIEYHETPVWVSAVFSKTKNGWRISGGDVIFAFSDWYNDDLSYKNVLDVPFLSETVAQLELNNSGLKSVYISNWKQLYCNEKKCEYIFEIPDKNGWYNAVYRYDPDYGNDTDPSVISGKWLLTGGGCYELAHGNENVSPYTGDRAGTLAAITVASLLCLSACVIFRRKKKAE